MAQTIKKKMIRESAFYFSIKVQQDILESENKDFLFQQSRRMDKYVVFDVFYNASMNDGLIWLCLFKITGIKENEKLDEEIKEKIIKYIKRDVKKIYTDKIINQI